MNADARDDSDKSSFAASADEAGAEVTAPKPVHNIMDVLLPARPPEPRNFRVVRLFDIEAAQTDPVPVTAGGSVTADTAPDGFPSAPAPAKAPAKPRLDPDSRAAARALRRKSLFASAGGLR